jgi:hypothetical protein
MLPSISNLDIAKSKRPTHELICCCLLNSENVKRETIFGAYSNAYSITFKTGVYFISL